MSEYAGQDHVAAEMDRLHGLANIDNMIFDFAKELRPLVEAAEKEPTCAWLEPTGLASVILENASNQTVRGFNGYEFELGRQRRLKVSSSAETNKERDLFAMMRIPRIDTEMIDLLDTPPIPMDEEEIRYARRKQARQENRL